MNSTEIEELKQKINDIHYSDLMQKLNDLSEAFAKDDEIKLDTPPADLTELEKALVCV